MIVVLSGEGPTDLGQCKNALGICSGEQYQFGPMAIMVDQLLEHNLKYSLRVIPDSYQYISESFLKEREMLRKTEKHKVSFVGKKRDQETGYFYINAWMLGEISIKQETSCQDTAIAVLFRDCDGTRSTKTGLWGAKHKSMVDGFNRSGFSRGVPMLPKPTSEAWLLCAAQKVPYQNCETLEDLPGNEASPNHPKKKLDAAFGNHKTADELSYWLEDNPFDFRRADSMPSFKAFLNALECAVNNLMAKEVVS